MSARTIVAAQIRVYVNKRLLGRCTGFQYSIQVPKKAVYGLDIMDPQELLATTTKVQGSLQVLRLDRDGGAEGLGVSAPFPDLSREKYWSLMLIDRRSETIIFSAERCLLQSQTWTIPNKGSVRGQLAFEALEYSNDVVKSGLEVSNGNT